MRISSSPVKHYQRFIFASLPALLLVGLFLALASPTYAADSGDATFEVTVDPVLSLSATSISEITNPSKNTLVTTSTTLNVSTNNSTGYTLSMTDPDGNSLVDSSVYNSSDANTFIASIDSAKSISSASDLGTNKWAFNKLNSSASPTAATLNSDSTAYNPLPTSTAVTLTATEAQAASSQTSVTFAVNAGALLPAGSYSDTVYFSVVANAAIEKPTNFNKIKTLQAMTSDICALEMTPDPTATTSTIKHNDPVTGNNMLVPTITLKDERDDQEYTVKKLADGNCWMTENLRFGIDASGNFRSWKSTDTALTNTTSTGASAMSSLSNSWSNTYTAPMVYITDANTKSSEGAKSTYGVYYNYCAATGGTVCNSSSMSADAAGSICPKGWQLPTMTDSPSGSNSGTTNGSVKSYENLLNLYGVDNAADEYQKIIVEPLSFVRGGFTSNNGSVLNRDFYGYYWTSSKYTSTTHAYYLFLLPSNIDRNNSNRGYGYSVRCVLGSSS